MTPLDILRPQFRPVSKPARRSRGPGKSGVYLLILDEQINYVGASYNVESRLFDHRNEGAYGDFDCMLYLALPVAVLRHYEGALIRALAPPRNRLTPRNCGYDAEILDGLGLPIDGVEDVVDLEHHAMLVCKRVAVYGPDDPESVQ